MIQGSDMIARLHEALEMTLSGQSIKLGEQALSELKESAQYPFLLFQYFQDESRPNHLRLMAAVQFQHWCKVYKGADDYLVQSYSQILSSLKQNLVGYYVLASQNLAKQIEQALLFLAQKEFPHRWEALPQELMHYAIDQNQTVKVLKLLHKITDRYSYSMRSDELYTEIILVCDTCHDALFSIAQASLERAKQGQDLLNSIKILKCVMKVFYSLNYQDLHPKFEDNLNNWMGLFSSFLQINIEPSQIGGHDITLFKAKGECLKSILLYATRYREEFQDLISHFAEQIWNMCSIVDEGPKYDKIVINALRYFKNLVLWQDLNSFFQNNLSQLMESLIIPNLGLTQNEKIQFESEPSSFLESFFQFSDINSRKSVTVDLLKSLAKGFPNELVGQIKVFLTKYKNQLDQTGSADSPTEIILLNLIIDGSTVAYREKEGVSDISLPAELITFVYENIIKVTLGKMFTVLCNNPNVLVENTFSSIHVCYYLRFFFYFRNYINRSEILELVRIISFFMRSQQESLVGLTAITIEGLLNLKDGDLRNYTNVKNVFNKENVFPQINEIINNLYLSAKSQEVVDSNILKTFQYIICLLKESSLSQIDILNDLFADQFKKVLGLRGYDFQKANTLFECIGNLLQFSSGVPNSQELTNKIESAISPFLNKIINDNLTDLTSFVLQVYAVIIQNSNDINKSTYKVIFESLFDANNWIIDSISVFPAYLIYISAYIYKMPQIIVEYSSQLQQILNKCLILKQDSTYFEFARLLIAKFDLQTLRQSGWIHYFIETSTNFYAELAKEVNTVSSKSKGSKPKFAKNLLVFIGYLISKYEGEQVIQDFNNVIQNLLTQILLNELPLIKSISDYTEKKIIFVALTNLLFKNTSALDISAFSSILNAIVENLGTRRFLTRYTEERDNLESMGGSGFQKLSCLKEKNSLIPEINNINGFFGLSFKIFYSQPNIQSSLDMTQILTADNQKTLSRLVTTNN